MKKVMTTPQMVKAKINYLEAETKRLTNRKKDLYSKKTQTFDTLSSLWITTYSYLKEVFEKEEYEKYLIKMNYIAKKMADYTILSKR